MNGVEEAVESAVILDALDRNGLDLLRRQKCKVDSIDLGRYGLRDIHLGDRPEVMAVDIPGSARSDGHVAEC